MGQVVSSAEGVTTILLWPMKAVADIKDTPLRGIAGATVALAVPYYLYGNPVPYVRDLDYVTLGTGYVIGGVGYWGATMTVDRFSP